MVRSTIFRCGPTTGLSSDWSNTATITPGDPGDQGQPGSTPTPTPTLTITPTAMPTPTVTITPTQTITPAAHIELGATPTSEALTDSQSIPTKTPRLTATPVQIEKVEVTPVPGAVTVQPDERNKLESGTAVIKFPSESRARTYQVAFAKSDSCGNMALGCVEAWFYAAEGEREYQVWTIRPLEISFTLSKSVVENFGGLDALFQVYATGGVVIQISDRLPGKWNDIRPTFFETNPDGEVIVYAMTRYVSSTFRLYADSRILTGPSGQADESGSTISPTPTAVSTPTATAAMEPQDTSLPITGGGLSSMTLILALVAAAIFMSLLVTIFMSDRSRPGR